MLKSFWIDNQKFLLLCGGALLGVVITSSLLGKFDDGTERTYEECRSLRSRIENLHKQLKQTYHDALNRAEAYAAYEKELQEELGLRPEPELAESRGLLIQLNREIDRTWASAQAEANRRGLALPEKIRAAEYVSSDYGPREYAILHSYLGIVGQALRSLVEAGMTRIGRPELIQEETDLPVLAGGGVGEPRVVGRLTLRGVGFTVTGPYESFVRLLTLVQEPKSYLQVRIAGTLSARGARGGGGDDGQLTAHLEFRGFRVEEPVEEIASALSTEGETESPRERRR